MTESLQVTQWNEGKLLDIERNGEKSASVQQNDSKSTMQICSGMAVSLQDMQRNDSKSR
jgi:hypothetical protein